MTLTPEEEELFRAWQVGRGHPGKIMSLDLPRTTHGPYGDLVKSYRFDIGENHFRAGEKIELDGRYLADRVQWATDYRWEILAFVTNIKKGWQGVDLYGGSPKWAHTFTVVPEALIKVDARNR